MRAPLFILAPPRSFTSVVCAMVGQHPAMLGLPEVNLSVTSRMETWLRLYLHTGSFLSHGLLRAVAELEFGGQSEDTVSRAGWWLEFRRASGTGEVFRELAAAAGDRAVVDKSPSTVLHPEFLRRTAETFPDARYLHLVRHPRATCASIQAAPEIMAAIAVFSKAMDLGACGSSPDPETLWLHSHRNITAFLETVPECRRLRLRGEDLITEPERHLAVVAQWAGIDVGPDSLDAMKRPERSPFAGFGPDGARFGNDPKFLENPALRSRAVRSQSIDGPVTWRSDGSGLSEEVKRLARSFGYS
jgi:hypothetical protein